MFFHFPRWNRWRRRIAVWASVWQRWPWLATWQIARQRFREDQLGQTAGSLTFTTLIALVPLLTVILAVFTAFPMFAKMQGMLETYLLQSLVPETIAKPVLDALTQFARKANKLGALGLVFLGVSALSLMLTVDRALNAVWRVRRPRPLGQRMLIYWAVLTLGPLLVGASLSLTSYAVSASKGLVSNIPGGLSVLLDVLEVLLIMSAMSWLFYLVPNTTVRWRHAWAGGLFVALGLELTKRGLGWYVSAVPSFSVIYGAFATLPIFFLWLYLSWSIVLLGAVIAAYAPALRHASRWSAGPGLPFALAVAALKVLGSARAQPGRGLTLEALAARIRAATLQLEPVIDMLIAHDWVAWLDEADGQRLVLICEPEQVKASDLARVLLLGEHPTTAGFYQVTGLDELSLAEMLRGFPAVSVTTTNGGGPHFGA